MTITKYLFDADRFDLSRVSFSRISSCRVDEKGGVLPCAT